MNILSLFDGMSGAQIALNRAGIKYDKYFASEVDKYAIKVAMQNYPNTIQLGDVREVKGSGLPKIDLIIGGSPCQGFSFAGKQLNFDDPRSSLFFEYVRLLKECNPKYFLLENVRMKREHLEVISELLKTEPILINSALVSAQNRQRYYWTNIPGARFPIEDKGITTNAIIEHSINTPNSNKWHKWFYRNRERELKKCHIKIINDEKKAICLTARQIQNWRGNIIQLSNKLYRHITPRECERLQTVPDNYTEGVSNTQRYKMLGNGFTVDVIAHLLKGMKNETKRI